MNELMNFSLNLSISFYATCNYCRGYHWYCLRYFILLYGVKRLVTNGDAISHAVLPGGISASLQFL